MTTKPTLKDCDICGATVRPSNRDKHDQFHNVVSGSMKELANLIDMLWQKVTTSSSQPKPASKAVSPTNANKEESA